MSWTQLDANQVIKTVYDTPTDSLKTINLSSLVPLSYDYLSLTYVAAGVAAGEIETVSYYQGGGTGTLIATLTLGYNAVSGKLETIART